MIYDIAATGDGVLVATGPAGRLYRVDSNRDVSLLTGVDARQITRFARNAPSGPVTAFATANPGRVVAIGAGQHAPATYVSAVRDSTQFGDLGTDSLGSHGRCRARTRSGQHRQAGRFVE